MLGMKREQVSKFKTYTLAEPTRPPSRPVLLEALVARVELEQGLTRVPKDGDLMLVAAGGVDFGFAAWRSPYSPTYGTAPSLSADMWTRSTDGSVRQPE
jgi:hypothetical protein